MNSFISTRKSDGTMFLTFDCVSPSELTDFFKLYDTDDDFLAYIGDVECDILLDNTYNGKRYIRTYVIELLMPCSENSKEWCERELAHIRDYISRRLGWE